MFTGIVEETGIIKKKILNLDGMELTIHANKVLEDLKVNDSISCSGICLTVTKLFDTDFVVQLVEETIDRTTAKFWDVDSRINLERSLLPTTRLGGHFVQGHIDTKTKIKNIKKNEESAVWDFVLTGDIKNYVVEKGSITIDGISLTVANVSKDWFTVSVIPQIFFNTNLQYSKVNDLVNIEFDYLTRFIISKNEKN